MQRTRECLVELQQLASDETNASRDKILDRVVDLFFLTSDTQSETERAVFGDVMERIAYELETEARARLAERLCETEKAPHPLVVRLAEDEIGVARPILEKSPCLSDDDLVNIAEALGQDHLHAISGRKRLSETVTDVIVERGNDAVLTKMARNRGATFSSSGLRQLSTRAGGNSELFSALEVRTDIPKEMLEEMKRTVADRLKEELAGLSSGITSSEIDAIVDEKASQMNLGDQDARPGKDKPAESETPVTEEMILAFARTRMVTETIQCLSLLCGMSFARVSHCLLEADLSALAVLCKANKFKNTTFAALIQLRATADPLYVRIIADAMRHYDLLDVATAQRTIEAVRERAAKKEKSDKSKEK